MRWHAARGLERLLAGRRRIAMQYSPQCAVPYVAMVDAARWNWWRDGVEVASSANLIQFFEAADQAKLESHLAAGVSGRRAA